MDGGICHTKHGSSTWQRHLYSNQFVSQFGVPDFLHTDQGRNFESVLLNAVSSLLGVSKTRTSPYHPQSIEWFNRTLLSLLSMATDRMNTTGTCI